MYPEHGTEPVPCGDACGILPSCAPLAVPYVPFQQTGAKRYEQMEALSSGTLYPGLDLPFRAKKTAAAVAEGPLTQLQALEFVVQELALYLDTHPTDTSAREEFSQAMAQRRQLLDAFAKEYEPLTLNCVCPDTNNKSESHTKYPGQKHFTWSDGPLPWDIQNN